MEMMKEIDFSDRKNRKSRHLQRSRDVEETVDCFSKFKPGDLEYTPKLHCTAQVLPCSLSLRKGSP